MTKKRRRTEAPELSLILLTAGGRITCRRCKAHSKRTGKQCGAPSMRGKAVCAHHGARSTGPKTKTGRAKCAEVKTVHGRETRAIRARRSRKLEELRELGKLGKAGGVIVP